MEKKSKKFAWLYKSPIFLGASLLCVSGSSCEDTPMPPTVLPPSNNNPVDANREQIEQRERTERNDRILMAESANMGSVDITEEFRDTLIRILVAVNKLVHNNFDDFRTEWNKRIDKFKTDTVSLGADREILKAFLLEELKKNGKNKDTAEILAEDLVQIVSFKSESDKDTKAKLLKSYTEKWSKEKIAMLNQFVTDFKDK